MKIIWLYIKIYNEILTVKREIMRLTKLTLLLGALCGSVALAETYNLGKIEVTTKEEVDTNSNVATISKEQIQNTSSQNVAEALRFESGVFYRPASNQRGEPGISIRGFSTTQIGLFYDGIPITSIYDRQTDWAQFITNDISEISVSKGYTSPVYGMNTMGGAINIISSKPTKELEATAKYTFISNNESQVAVGLGSNLGSYYFSASYSYIDRDSYNLSKEFHSTPYQDNGEKKNSFYTNHTLKAKAGFIPSEDHEYSLNLIYQKGEKGGLVSSTGGNLWKWPRYDKTTVYLLGNSFFTDSLSLNSRLYYDSFYNELNALGRLQTNGSVSGGYQGTSIYDDHTLGGVFTVGYDFDADKNLKVGVNLKQDNHKNTDRGANADPSTKLGDLSTSVFTEYAQRINDTFRFILSAGYDRNDMLKVEIPNNDDDKISLDGFNAQGVLYASLSENLVSHINVGKKDKLPSLKDRYSTIWGQRVPNNSLSPESAINYEVGLDYEDSSTKAGAAVFYNDLTDMLMSVPDGSGSCIVGVNCQKLINTKEGYSYGAEVFFSKSFTDDVVTLGFNYTYTQKKTTNEDSSNYGIDGKKILDYPNHMFNANFLLKPTKQIDFITLVSYQSQAYTLANNAYTKINDIFLVDVKLNYRFYKDWQGSFGVTNLFDKNYYYGAYNYMAGRRFLASVEYTF